MIGSSVAIHRPTIAGSAPMPSRAHHQRELAERRDRGRHVDRLDRRLPHSAPSTAATARCRALTPVTMASDAGDRRPAPDAAWSDRRCPCGSAGCRSTSPLATSTQTIASAMRAEHDVTAASSAVPLPAAGGGSHRDDAPRARRGCGESRGDRVARDVPDDAAVGVDAASDVDAVLEEQRRHAPQVVGRR